MQYEITITEKHLDKALKECNLESSQYCLIAQAVAEKMGYNLDTMITGFQTFGNLKIIVSQRDSLVSIIKQFDRRLSNNDYPELRKCLPQTFTFESE